MTTDPRVAPGLGEVAVRPHPGPGLVARFGDVVIAVAVDRDTLLNPLLEVCGSVGAAGGDGRRLVRRLAGLLSEADVDPPAFCVVAPVGRNLAVFVCGDADVLARGGGDDQVISSRQSAAWVDRVVPWPLQEVSATVGDSASPQLSDVLDLRAGIVTGSGFLLVPVTAPLSLVVDNPPGNVAAPLRLDDNGTDPPILEPLALAVDLPVKIATTNFESVSLIPDADAVAPVESTAPPEPMVEGIVCKRGHFNGPQAAFCGVCGISMVQQTQNKVPGVRPPLGLIVLDDGAVFTLDNDYVIGREPERDFDVKAGRARPLMLDDADGSVSRAHVAVRLRDWDVEISDLGSVNGTYIAPPGATTWTPLAPFEPVTISPGTRVQVGRRTFVFDSHHRASATTH